MSNNQAAGPSIDPEVNARFVEAIRSGDRASPFVQGCLFMRAAIEASDPDRRLTLGKRALTLAPELVDLYAEIVADVKDDRDAIVSRSGGPAAAPAGAVADLRENGWVAPAWGTLGPPVSPLHFGHNAVWVRNGLGLWDPAAGAPTPAVLDLVKRLGPGVLRFPGGTRAMRYHYDQAIGARRIPQCDPYTGSTDATGYGLDEFLRLAGSVGAEVTLVTPWVDGTPQEAAALVAYVNASPDNTFAIGRDYRRDWGTAGDWARLRAANGHENPYGVKFLEIGNEQYLTLGTPPATSCDRPSKFVQCERWDGTKMVATTASDHAEQVSITGNLVRQVDPAISIGASAFSPQILIGERGVNGTNAFDASSQKDPDGDPWNVRLAHDAADAFDYFVLHPYNLTRNPFAPGDPTILAEQLERTIDELQAIAPSKRVAVTEFGYLFRSGGILGVLLAAHVIRVAIEKKVMMVLRHILIEDQPPASDPLSEISLNLREPFADSAAIMSAGRVLMPAYGAMSLLRSTLAGDYVPATTNVPGLVAFATRDSSADRLAVVLARSKYAGQPWEASIALPAGAWDARTTIIHASRLYAPYDRVQYDHSASTGLVGTHLVTVSAHALVVVEYRRGRSAATLAAHATPGVAQRAPAR
jgi:hypothetical protein